MSRLVAALGAFLAGLCALAAPAAANDFPARAAQGELVVARVAPQARVEYAGRSLRVSPDGWVALGIARDAHGTATVRVHEGGRTREVAIAVEPRDFPVERIRGVPPTTVEPPPAIAERIRREQAKVTAARRHDDAREDFLGTFQWPVRGRISGRFGNRRVYVVEGRDVPGAPHSGMDLAAPAGTVVRAPAAGIVRLAEPDLYLTGGTILLDHGHGIGSNYLHLSALDVKAGQRVEPGQPIGRVGATGRASGPHLHWGLTWFDLRLDPLLLPGIDAAAQPATTPGR